MPLTEQEAVRLSALMKEQGHSPVPMNLFLWLVIRLKKGPSPVSYSEAAQALGCSAKTIQRSIKVVKECGLVRTITAIKGGPMVFELDRVQASGEISGDGDSFVYVVSQVGPGGAPIGPVKIGRTSDMNRRLAGLITSSPLRLSCVGLLRFDASRTAASVEKALHAEFSGIRLHGEWFDLEPKELWKTLQARFPGRVVLTRESLL